MVYGCAYSTVGQGSGRGGFIGGGVGMCEALTGYCGD
jgi:hypothetical protein